MWVDNGHLKKVEFESKLLAGHAQAFQGYQDLSKINRGIGLLFNWFIVVENILELKHLKHFKP